MTTQARVSTHTYRVTNLIFYHLEEQEGEDTHTNIVRSVEWLETLPCYLQTEKEAGHETIQETTTIVSLGYKVCIFSNV